MGILGIASHSTLTQAMKIMCNVRRMLIKLVIFPYYWKFNLDGREVAVGSCLRASGVGVSCIGKLNESVGAK